MGITERIKQIYTERAQIASDLAEVRNVELQKHQQMLHAERKPRVDFVNSQLEKINGATGVLNMLEEIDNEYWGRSTNPLGSGTAHGITRNINEDGVLQYRLVWRKNYSHVQYVSPEQIGSGYGFYSTEVVINPDSESITISGEAQKVVSKEEWIKDKKVLEDALINAFMNPWYSGEDSPTGWF